MRFSLKKGISMILGSKHSTMAMASPSSVSVNGENLTLESGIQACSGDGCDNNFECNICLELPQDPVVTMCGHLFCWSCLYRWLQSASEQHRLCPVCKSDVASKNSIIPLYGRGETPHPNTHLKSKVPCDGSGNDEKIQRIIPSRPRPRPQPAASRHSQADMLRQRQSPGISFQQSNVVFGGHVPFSASFGIFPSLFGFYLSEPDQYGTGAASVYNSPPRFAGFPAASSMIVQQRRLIEQQEFVLYWFFILLACFAIGCFLFF